MQPTRLQLNCSVSVTAVVEPRVVDRQPTTRLRRAAVWCQRPPPPTPTPVALAATGTPSFPLPPLLSSCPSVLDSSCQPAAGGGFSGGYR
jgi:hypothetical protein